MTTVAGQRAPWQNPRILSTLLLVFLAGASSGALSMRLGLHDKLHRTGQPNREVVLQKFRNQLDLSGAQTQQIGMVLDDYGQYYESLEEQLDDLRATGKTRILQILDPDQRAKFQKIMMDLAPQLTGNNH
jgi:Spy/CpxP family protein refolding chaperone